MTDDRTDPSSDTEAPVAPAPSRPKRTRKPGVTSQAATSGGDQATAVKRTRRKPAAAEAAEAALDVSTSVDTTSAPKRARRAGLPVRDEPAPGRADGDEGARQALELGRRVVDLAADRKAADIVLIHVGDLTTLADYLVICSGGSERQLGAIADGIAQGLKDEGITAIGREGEASAHWVLLDFGSVIVHVFAQPERDFYQLEKLWADAPMLLRVQ